MATRDYKVFCTNDSPLASVLFKHYSACDACKVSDPYRNDVAQLLRQADDIFLPPKTVLYHEHDLGDYIFILREGLVKLVRYSSDGAQRIVRLLRTGDCGGMECLMALAYEHTAIAVNSVKACRVPASCFNKLVEGRPWLYGLLIEHWHHSLQQADNWIVLLSTGPVRCRIAHLISLLATPVSDERNATVKLLCTQDMAAILGVTLESVSRAIADLKRKGILQKVKGDVYRYDVATLDRITKI